MVNKILGISSLVAILLMSFLIFMIGVVFTRIYAFWILVVLAIGSLGYVLSIIMPDFPKAKKLINKLTDPMIGKTIFKYNTSGCQAQNISFAWSGKIVERFYHEQHKDLMFYRVEIKNDVQNFEQTIPSWCVLKSDNGQYEYYD